jgi:cyclase
MPSGYTVYVNGGRIDTNTDLLAWASRAEKLGAGEICLNSIDTDGARNGFDIEMLRAVCGTVKIPVIASGGAGALSHFPEVFERTNASAALAASLFHFRELTVSEVKKACGDRGILVRI